MAAKGISLAQTYLRLKELDDTVGTVDDVVVSAGAAGTQSAKLRRLTTDLSALLAIEEAGENTVVAGSGQKLTAVAADTDYSVTVVALASYLVTAQDGRIHLGISDGTGDDTLILWTVPAGVTMPITIPSGTSLHYFSETAGVVGRISRIN